MIGVSERAKEELKKMLSDQTDNPLAGLRLGVAGQNTLSLGMDVEAPGDVVVEHEGSKVLMVEQELADRLQGISLDVEDTPEGAKLVISQDS